jgi:hypothetical protein
LVNDTFFSSLAHAPSTDDGAPRTSPRSRTRPAYGATGSENALRSG